MNSYISVHKCDIYNQEELNNILSSENIQVVDSVYFSGSFSLLPDPQKALVSVTRVLKQENDDAPNGKVYITQTYQKKPSFWMRKIKPMLKFLTTIDFGQLVTVEEIRDLLEHVEGLTLEQHEVMQGSLDNYWQAAYLSVLVKKNSNVEKQEEEVQQDS
jgi:ubiquinone/menaquinone biosynthesis C-methylase UbiE